MQRKNCTPVSRLALKHRSNQDLVEGAKSLAGRGRIITAHLVAHLAEIYARKLHAAEGFSYLGDYCQAVLGMSEDEGKRRAHVAMLAEKYPVILDMLLEGSIHLTTVRIIGKCLTPKNHRQVLNAARGKTNTELEHLAAVLNPKPDMATVLRKLPEPRLENAPLEEAKSTGGTGDLPAVSLAVRKEVATRMEEGAVTPNTNGQAPEQSEERAGTGLEVRWDGVLVQVVPPGARRPRLAPLSEKRYSLQLTINQEAHDALRELQDLLRHQVPNGDLVTIVQDSILERRDRVKREKSGQRKRPRKAREQESLIEDGTTAVRESLGAAGDSATKAPEHKVAEKTEMATDMAIPQDNARAAEAMADMGESAASAPGRLANSRHIPAAVKREVWHRDQGRCAFVSRSGKRCGEKGRLEYHHIHAHALGGPPTVENIALFCRAHNAYEGVRVFGKNRPGANGSSVPDRGAAARTTVSNRPGTIASRGSVTNAP